MENMSTAVRTALRSEIELTREKFHRFLVTVPDCALKLPSKVPVWTNGEILYRMSLSPLVIKSMLKRNFGHWSRLLLPKLVTGPLRQRGDDLYIRSRSHRSTLWCLANLYENNCNLVLEMLDELSDDDFEKNLVIPDGDPLLSRQVTVEQLFHYVKNHFDSYRKQINSGK